MGNSRLQLERTYQLYEGVGRPRMESRVYLWCSKSGLIKLVFGQDGCISE